MGDTRVGARAAALLREVVNCEPENLPPYNDEAVRLVIDECHEHNALMQQIINDLEAKSKRRRARRARRAAAAAAAAAAATAAADGDGGGADENADPPLAQARPEEEAGAADDAGGADAFAEEPESAAAVVVHYEAILRNKRLLLTYLTERMDRLKALRWKGGAGALPPRIASGLAPSEASFYADYDRALAALASSRGGGLGLDLAAGGGPPPAGGGGDAMVLVVAPGGLGEVAFSTGTFLLGPGSVHSLPRAEVAALVAAGAVAEVTEGAREEQNLPVAMG